MYEYTKGHVFIPSDNNSRCRDILCNVREVVKRMIRIRIKRMKDLPYLGGLDNIRCLSDSLCIPGHNNLYCACVINIAYFEAIPINKWKDQGFVYV